VTGYATATLGLCALGPAWALACAPVLAAAALRDWRRTRAASALCWHPDGRWSVPRPDGDPVILDLDGTTVVTPWLVVLVLRSGRSRRRVALARDAVPAEDWRRLRARLRVQGAALAAGRVGPR